MDAVVCFLGQITLLSGVIDLIKFLPSPFRIPSLHEFDNRKYHISLADLEIFLGGTHPTKH